MTNYVSTNDTRHIDMRPKVTQALHDELERRASLFGIPKNTYVAMLLQVATNLPSDVLYNTINAEIDNGRA